MKRLPLLTAIGLSLALSPVVLSTPATADPNGALPYRAAHKALALLHWEGESGCPSTRQISGASLEMTDAAI